MIHYDDLVPVQVIVTIWVSPEADVQEVVSEMDYNFTHPAIQNSEIRDINYEI